MYVSTFSFPTSIVLEIRPYFRPTAPGLQDERVRPGSLGRPGLVGYPSKTIMGAPFLQKGLICREGQSSVPTVHKWLTSRSPNFFNVLKTRNRNLVTSRDKTGEKI